MPPTKLICFLFIPNEAYREPVVAMVEVRRFEIVAAEEHVVRNVREGRGRPIVAEARIVDTRAVAVARGRQKYCTSCLHLRPLCESVAVVCPVRMGVRINSGES